VTRQYVGGGEDDFAFPASELLNQRAFADRDRYGRLLRTVTRDGESLGDTLVNEGLAEEWRGYRGSWC